MTETSFSAQNVRHCYDSSQIKIISAFFKVGSENGEKLFPYFLTPKNHMSDILFNVVKIQIWISPELSIGPQSGMISFELSLL